MAPGQKEHGLGIQGNLYTCDALLVVSVDAAVGGGWAAPVRVDEGEEGEGVGRVAGEPLAARHPANRSVLCRVGLRSPTAGSGGDHCCSAAVRSLGHKHCEPVPVAFS